jgi:PPOX class probable F420-dependent enzyme
VAPPVGGPSGYAGSHLIASPFVPSAPVPPDVDAYLRDSHFAVIASLRPDGAPHTATTWYEWDGERVYLSMDEVRVRLDYIRRDPRVALTVLDREDWYRHVTLLGRVEAVEEDVGLEGIDRLARRYVGKPYPDRSRRRYGAWMAVESWHGWDAARQGGLWRVRQPSG